MLTRLRSGPTQASGRELVFSRSFDFDRSAIGSGMGFVHVGRSITTLEASSRDHVLTANGPWR